MKIVILILVCTVAVFGRRLKKTKSKNEEADKKILIRPGTLWCGTGNKASSPDELGRLKELDSCCRTHDQCPRSISGFSKDYEYRNWLPFTVSDCECDREFHSCLKGVTADKTEAEQVGYIFFKLLSMPCVEFNEGGTKAEKGAPPTWS